MESVTPFKQTNLNKKINVSAKRLPEHLQNEISGKMSAPVLGRRSRRKVKDDLLQSTLTLWTRIENKRLKTAELEPIRA